MDENDNAPTFQNTPYEGLVSEESEIDTTVFKWIHVEDLDKVGEPLEVRCESYYEVSKSCFFTIDFFKIENKYVIFTIPF